MELLRYFSYVIILLLLAGLYDYSKAKAKDDKESKEKLNKLEETRKINEKAEEEKKKNLKAAEERKSFLNDELNRYHNSRKLIIKRFDKDSNGEIDLIPDNDFTKLLKMHQSSIAEIDKSHIQKFVKISNFILFKKKNIIELYSQLSILSKINSNDISEEQRLQLRNPSLSHFNRLSSIEDLLQIENHTYESVIFHSISMITALLKNDLITFYEIFESFDKLGIFNSNWENVVTEKLSNIEDKLSDLIESIKQLGNQIEHSLDSLSYTYESSFTELNKSVTAQLTEIGSSLDFNNVLTGIQVYQNHKLNKNIKSIK